MGEKEDILKLIQEKTASNGGVPPGSRKFSKVTGVGPFAWGGKYWSTWGEAVREAGFEPQKAPTALDDDFILECVCKLCLSLGKFPSVANLYMAKRVDPSFPHRSVVMKRFGTLDKLSACVASYARTHPEYSAVISFCAAISEDDPVGPSGTQGWVYLVCDGRRHKIGRTLSLEDRIPELSYQSSQRVDLVHKIATDDPVGIEKYWHDRFAAKRKFGEWFELDAKDVAAFRKRKKFM
jgi:hypothetical protein